MQFEVSTALTKEVELDRQKKFKLGCWIALIVGIIGLFGYIVVAVVCFEENNEPFWLDILLWGSAALFAIGLIFLIAFGRVAKKMEGNIRNVYSFDEEYVTVCSYRGEEKIGEAKNYYTEFTKVSKTENYLYLYMELRGAYPILLFELTEEQTNWLKEKVKANKRK